MAGRRWVPSILVLMGALLLWSPSSMVHASSAPPAVSEEDAIRQGQSVVAGSFSGARTRFEHTVSVIGDDGVAAPVVVEILACTFMVGEQLEGDPLPEQVSVHLTPAQLSTLDSALLEPGNRVVVSLVEDRRVERDGYVVTHGKVIDARDDARLDELRGWVRQLRQPRTIDPESIVDALEQHRSETDPPLPEPLEPGAELDYDGAMEDEENIVGSVDPHARPRPSAPVGAARSADAGPLEDEREAEPLERVSTHRPSHASIWIRKAVDDVRRAEEAQSRRPASPEEPADSWWLVLLLVPAVLGFGYGYRRLLST